MKVGLSRFFGRKPNENFPSVIVAIAIVAALLIGVVAPIRHLIFGPKGLVNDPSLEQASKKLAAAEAKLSLLPGDDAAHFDRAQAYLEFGYLEGARLEWSKRPKESGHRMGRSGEIA